MGLLGPACGDLYRYCCVFSRPTSWLGVGSLVPYVASLKGLPTPMRLVLQGVQTPIIQGDLGLGFRGLGFRAWVLGSP